MSEVVPDPPPEWADVGTDPRASAWPPPERTGDVAVEVCPRAAGAVPMTDDPCGPLPAGAVVVTDAPGGGVPVATEAPGAS